MFAFAELSRIDIRNFLEVMFKFMSSGSFSPVELELDWKTAPALTSCKVPNFLNVPDIRDVSDALDFGLQPCWLCFGFRGAFAEFLDLK